MKTIRYYCDHCQKEAEYGHMVQALIKDTGPAKQETIHAELCCECWGKIKSFVEPKIHTEDELTKEIHFNLNNEVKVKLNEKGKEIYLSHLKKVSSEPECAFVRETNSDGYTTFQLWDLMKLFGDYMRLGEEPVFENNEIIFKEEQE